MFDLEQARRLAATAHDAAKLARRLEAACDEITRLKAERDRLREALEWYANVLHKNGSSGDIARAALGEKP